MNLFSWEGPGWFAPWQTDARVRDYQHFRAVDVCVMGFGFSWWADRPKPKRMTPLVILAHLPLLWFGYALSPFEIAWVAGSLRLGTTYLNDQPVRWTVRLTIKPHGKTYCWSRFSDAASNTWYNGVRDRWRLTVVPFVAGQARELKLWRDV